jgi:hypothetical protein
MSHIGELLAGQLIDIGAIESEFAPPHAQAVDHTRSCTPRYDRFATVFAALVEHPHLVTALYLASASVGFVDFQNWLTFCFAQALDIHK